ncbi:MAG: ATP-dependent DNA helicase RecG [Rhodovibrionaceae bacterium]
MRPDILNPLFAEITALSGIGPRFAKLFETLLDGGKVADLCWHLPYGLIDRRYAPSLAGAEPGRIATVTLRVLSHQPGRTPRQPYRVLCADDSGEIELIFFHARESYLRKQLPEGETRVVSGRIETFGGRLQMTHPDHIVPLAEAESVKTVEPVYRLTSGLTLKTVSKAIGLALKRAPELPEWLDPAHAAREAWPPWRQALLRAHAPECEADLLPETPQRQRLAYDELLANQLALSLVRLNQRRIKGRSIRGDGRLVDKARAALSFTLTASQQAAWQDIAEDMATESRMMRLLQGDVGSGKTVVALLAMLRAVESGAQAAMMAPTEILARQHYQTVQPLAAAAGLDCVLLTGRDKGKARAALLERLASGDAPLVIGTHALFQDDVAFKDLALAVVDEQHRFGVHQRMTLAGKGRGVDFLVMTATPIPRTLLLTSYGDMDVSRLTEKPAGRKPIDTRVLPLDRLSEVIEGVGRAIREGAKVYWVCPLVAESEVSDLAAVEDRHRELAGHFGEAEVGLVHGRLKGPAKDNVMESFRAGPLKVLVATTVIEVGVDVPEASVMVIEHAERFGLAQLHQLRGRIGRGAAKSSCLLLYQTPLGETARARLKAIRESEDGFKIAEEDLRLRGAGELLGTRQSGLPEFRLADLAVHGELMATARDDARLVLERDPELTGKRGQALRVLLYLLERDEGVRYLRSG